MKRETKYHIKNSSQLQLAGRYSPLVCSRVKSK